MKGADVASFVGRLDQKSLRRSGPGWIARCPAHDDRRQSLSVGQGDDGKLLLRCFAGCQFQDILDAAGAPRAQRRVDPSPPSLAITQPGIVAEYDYTAPDGTLLYQALRYEPKDFRVRTPKATGGWDWSLRGTDRVLYNLPVVIEAAAEGRRVYVTEGEKDADRLMKLGVVATTNQGGAAQPWLPQYTAALAGASVVVLPDNDVPGERHAAAVAGALHAAGIDVRVASLPGLPPKGDVSDWLDRGHSIADLESLAQATPVWAPTELGNEEEPPAAYPTATCALNPPPSVPIKWLIQDLWTASEIGFLVGDGGSYKSTTALHMALAVAGGYKVFGRFDTGAGAPVFIVSEEDPASVLQNRIEAMLRGHGWNRERTLPNVHYFALEGAKLTDPAWKAHLRSEVERLAPALVVLDPLAELVDGDENSNTEMRAVIQAARYICRPSGAAPMFVHHAGKAGEGKRKIDRIRGASAFFNAARNLYFLESADGAIAVECVKLSRGVKPLPFVVRPVIESDPQNHATWTLARFEFESAADAAMDRAEAFLLEQLGAMPGLSTKELRDAGKREKINNVALSKAQNVLEMRGVITFDGGEPGKAKSWRLTLPSDSRQGWQGQTGTLPNRVEPCLAGSAQGALTLPAPYRGAGSAQGDEDNSDDREIRRRGAA